MFNKISAWKINTPTAILIGALALSLSHVAYAYILKSDAAQTPSKIFAGRTIDGSDLITGNKSSDVVIVEYSDTECPFCATLHPTIKQLKEEYKEKVGFVYRYFPLTQIHPNAFEEARAISCVGKISGADKRMEFINDMFAYKISNKNMTLPKNGKEDLVRNLGIDFGKYSECMKNQESSDIISASINEGVTAGVEGTPATFILAKTRKGYEVVSMISGAQSYSYFKAAVDEALSR